MLAHDFGHLCCGRRFHVNIYIYIYFFMGSLTLEFRATWKHLPIIADCMLIRRRLLVHADEPFSVNTAQPPESSCTMPPTSEHDSPFVLFCSFGAHSEYFEMTDVHQCTKENLFFLSLCASRVTSFLLSILFNCQAGIVSNFFHSLSTAAFASGICIA